MSTGQPVIKSRTMNRPDLCLEFANTRFWRGQAEPTETLNGAGGSRGVDGRQWRAAPGKPPARRDSSGPIELRETLHRLFDAEAQDKTPAARDLAALNEALAAAPARTALRRERGAYGWEVDAKSATALALLAPVLGRPATFWPARASTASGAAPTPNAAGCSSTTAAPASGAGARCSAAATAPRPGATTIAAASSKARGRT